MHARTLLACALVCAGLSGCDLLDGLRSPVEQRINQAVPFSPDVESAWRAIESMTEDDKATGARIRQEFDARSKIRALNCAAGYVPSRFASLSEIRKAIGDRSCFRESDVALGKWLGLRRAGLLLAVPATPSEGSAPARYVAVDDPIQAVRFASAAPVAAIDTQSKRFVVDLLTGRTLFSEARSSQVGTVSLSPNGRIFVTQEGGSSRLRDARTGESLLFLQDAAGSSFKWLDARTAIYTAAEQRLRSILIDFPSGREVPLSMIGSSALLAAPVPGESDQYALFTYASLARIQVNRSGLEPEVSLLSEQRLEGQVPAPQTSGLTADAASAFVTKALGVLVVPLAGTNVDDVTLAPLQLHSATATPDPDKLLVRGSVQKLPMRGPATYVLSLRERTLAPVDTAKLPAPDSPLYAPFTRRLMFKSGSRLESLEAIPTAEPIAVSQFAADMSVAIGQAAIEAASKAAEVRSAAMPPYGADGRLGAGNDVLPGPVAALSRDARVEAVGVYQGTGASSGVGMPRRGGFVDVRVRRSSAPIVLVLSSYEGVRWNLISEPGARIAAVLVSSYYPAQVVGSGQARVVMIGQNHAYKLGGPEYAQLQRDVMRWTGKPIEVFQGRYDGAMFSVGSGS